MLTVCVYVCVFEGACVYLKERVGRVVVMRREQGLLTQNGEGMTVIETFFRRRKTGKNILEGRKSLGEGCWGVARDLMTHLRKCRCLPTAGVLESWGRGEKGRWGTWGTLRTMACQGFGT